MKRSFSTGLVATLVLIFVSAQTTSSYAQECPVPETPVSEIELIGKAETNLKHHVRLNSVYQARQLLECILKWNPDTPFRDRIDADLYQAQEILADHSFKIADFYMARYRSTGRGLKGAESRLLEVVRAHPRFSQMDEVLLRLGTIAMLDERPDEAASYFRRLVCSYPKNTNRTLAITKLAELGFDSKQKCDGFKQ